MKAAQPPGPTTKADVRSRDRERERDVTRDREGDRERHGGRSREGDRDDVLHSLHDHARRLADGLPGQLGRIRVCSGDVAIEIEWLAQPGTIFTDAVVPSSPTGGDTENRPGGTEAAFVTSPVVGTFYRAPEPNAEPYVKVGDVVQPGQVVGVVEAMKLMNPVTVEIGGTVAIICVQNGEPVEFDQDLVEITPHL